MWMEWISSLYALYVKSKKSNSSSFVEIAKCVKLGPIVKLFILSAIIATILCKINWKTTNLPESSISYVYGNG